MTHAGERRGACHALHYLEQHSWCAGVISVIDQPLMGLAAAWSGCTAMLEETVIAGAGQSEASAGSCRLGGCQRKLEAAANGLSPSWMLPCTEPLV